MHRLKEHFGNITDCEIHLKAWIYDWFWQETINGTAVTKVYADGCYVTALGNKFRPFKPSSKFEIVVSVYTA